MNKKGVIYYLGWMMFLNLIFIVSTLVFFIRFDFAYFLVMIGSGGLSAFWLWVEKERIRRFRKEGTDF